MKNMRKAYGAPILDVILLSADDVLTFSAGFDGDEHEFELPM